MDVLDEADSHFLYCSFLHDREYVRLGAYFPDD
jgi:hypothetical protein